MPATIIPKETSLHVLQHGGTATRDDEPRPGALELVQRAMDGCFSAEHLLEQLLERSEHLV